MIASPRRSKTVSRFSSRERSSKDKRERARGISEEGQQQVVLEESGDEFATGDELDDFGEEECEAVEEVKEGLEKVMIIISGPENGWRTMPEEEAEDRSPTALSNEMTSYAATTTKPHLIQEKFNCEDDIMSLFKVDSAVSWLTISSHLTLTLDPVYQEEEENKKDRTSFTATSVKKLQAICWQVKPWDQKKDNRLFTSMFAAAWGCDCDEVLPGIFIGDKASASNVRFLQVSLELAILNQYIECCKCGSYYDSVKIFLSTATIICNCCRL